MKYKALRCDIQHLSRGTTEYNEVEKLVSHNQVSPFPSPFIHFLTTSVGK